MRGWIAGSIAATLLGLAAASAAEQNEAPPRPSVDLNVDLKVGRDGFRLGGQLFGPDGVWGAWLNGALREGGFTLDGRVQEPGRAFKFKMNADIDGSLLGGLLGGGTAPRSFDSRTMPPRGRDQY